MMASQGIVTTVTALPDGREFYIVKINASTHDSLRHAHQLCAEAAGAIGCTMPMVMDHDEQRIKRHIHQGMVR